MTQWLSSLVFACLLTGLKDTPFIVILANDFLRIKSSRFPISQMGKLRLDVLLLP